MNFLNKISTKIFALCTGVCVLIALIFYFIQQNNIQKFIHRENIINSENQLLRISSNIQRNIMFLENNIWSSDAGHTNQNNLKNIRYLIEYNKKTNQNIILHPNISQDPDIDDILNLTKGFVGNMRAKADIELFQLPPSSRYPHSFVVKRIQNDTYKIAIYESFHLIGSVDSKDTHFFLKKDLLLPLTATSQPEILQINTSNKSAAQSIQYFKNNRTAYFAYHHKLKFLDNHELVIVKTNNALAASRTNLKICLILIIIGILILYSAVFYHIQNLSKELELRAIRLDKIASGNLNKSNLRTSILELEYMDFATDNIIETIKSALTNTKENSSINSMLKITQKMNSYLNPENQVNLDGFCSSQLFYRPTQIPDGSFFGALKDKEGSIVNFYGRNTETDLNAILLSVIIKSKIVHYVEQGFDLAQIVIKLNEDVYHKFRMDHEFKSNDISCKFLIIKLDPSSNNVNYINCGMEKPIVIDRQNQNLSTLNEIQLPLGIRKHQDYIVSNAQLHAGESIVFYNSGLPRLRSINATTWGIKSILQILSSEPENSTIDRHKLILQKAAKFSQGVNIESDLFLMSLHIDKQWQTSFFENKKLSSNAI